MKQGTVKWYDSKKGYGFISPDGEAKDVFVHVSQLEKAGVAQAETLVTEAGHLRLWPHRHTTDGFYAAAWERKA